VQTVLDDKKTASNNKELDKIDEINNHQSSDSSLEKKNHRYECRSCGYIYDPLEGLKKFDIPKGQSFLEINKEKFRCPVCRAGYDAYKDIGPRLKPSGFDENLGYGFGFNTLPSGQKNVLIFGGLALAAACFLSLYSLR
tara:strand:- start:245 stop:661 length:417 start_codon:yes stop_codon:yes gene_type:complete